MSLARFKKSIKGLINFFGNTGSARFIRGSFKFNKNTYGVVLNITVAIVRGGLLFLMTTIRGNFKFHCFRENS